MSHFSVWGTPDFRGDTINQSGVYRTFQIKSV